MAKLSGLVFVLVFVKAFRLDVMVAKFSLSYMRHTSKALSPFSVPWPTARHLHLHGKAQKCTD